MTDTRGPRIPCYYGCGSFLNGSQRWLQIQASTCMRCSAPAQGPELQEFATTGFFAPFPLGGQSYLDHWDGELADLITTLSQRVRALFSLGSSGA